MSISHRRRFQVLKRDRFTCQYCGVRAPRAVLEVDHIAPRSHGGCDDFDNLITACERCNSGKSDELLSHEESQIVDGEVPGLIWEILKYAHKPGVVAELSAVSETRMLADWVEELWAILGGLHYDDARERDRAAWRGEVE